jgi:proton-translocating NADH-quinone oxidoreductase chain N
MAHEVRSILPALIVFIPAGLGLLMAIITYAGRRGTALPRQAGPVLAIAGSFLSLAVAIALAVRAAQGDILVGWRNELRVDGLSALLVVAISLIGSAAALFALRYMVHAQLLSRVGEQKKDVRTGVFYTLYLFFVATMLWGCVTNNIVMLYVAIEATTIASGLLVAFYWDRRGLEAGYKYLMLLTVGITFALFGCVLLYTGCAGLPEVRRFSLNPLLISDLGKVAGHLPRTTALLAAAFLIVGFGTKAGIAPFHPWLPDAHAEAPTPVSALLSGVMLKMAAYALVRTVGILYHDFAMITTFVVILGAFTMLLGALMTLVQDDLKRLLAYSSVGQMGYVIMGLGLGTYLGVFGGLFHLINHAVYKGLLFMATGAVIFAAGGRRNLQDLGGLGKRMPVTAACFFIGALALSGMPPFNGFWSKLTIYLAGAEAKQWWASIVAMGCGILTLVAMVHVAYRIFWGAPRDPGLNGSVREVPATMLVPMVALAGICVVVGIYPQIVYPLVNKAALAIVHTVSGTAAGVAALR